MENYKIPFGVACIVIVALVVALILQARSQSKKRELWEHTQHQMVEVLARREQLN